MKILCTHPGRHGDILWALPTVRAIAHYFAQPVDFVTSHDYRRVLDVIAGQEYIDKAYAAEGWKLRETAPITPIGLPPELYAGLGYDHVFDLGLTAWPMEPIALAVKNQTSEKYELPLNRFFSLEPWIELPRVNPGVELIALGWSKEWIEIKMGVSFALFQFFAGKGPHFHLVTYPQSRLDEWAKLWPSGWVGWHATHSWKLRAQILAEAKLFVGCLSGMWVLANAMGLPTVIMEPAEGRWNKAFWLEAPRNHLVLGNDGRPTFDARAVCDAVDSKLRGLRER